MICFDNLRNQVGCPSDFGYAPWAALAIGVILLLVILIYGVYPVYNVWASRKTGQAELAEALAQLEVLATQADETLAQLDATGVEVQNVKERSEQYRAQLTTARRSLHDIELK